MLIKLDEFRARLKSLGLPVYRDKADVDTSYPYYVYSFVSGKRETASGNTYVRVNEFQISLFTTGTEKELTPFEAEFANVPHTAFASIVGDENDDTVTNFHTYLEVIV